MSLATRRFRRELQPRDGFMLVTLTWLLLPAFVGFNMLQAAFTRFCPLAMILKKLGAHPGAAFE